ncbi:MAG: glycosyltransferase family 2 protein [Planctomycetaceae bacterium]
MPEVSVLLPVRNAENTVAAAVRSILDQTHDDFELIVIDDGSTDRTAHIVADIRDKRLKLIPSQHAGVCAANNLGTAAAQSDLIARMDADDWAHPERLEQQVAYLRQHKVDVVGCKVRILDAAGQPSSTLRRYERWINEETLTTDQIHALRFVEFPLVNPTLLARRSYFEIGFEDNDLPEDYDLMLRAMAQGFRFGKVPDVLLHWTDGPTRLTRTDPRYSPTAFMECRRRHLLTGPLRDVRTLDLWGAGQTGKPWLLWLQRQGIHVRRLIDVHHGKIGQTIHGVPVIAADQLPMSDGVPLIIAVGADRTRNLIWPHVTVRGFRPGQDTWFVA